MVTYFRYDTPENQETMTKTTTDTTMHRTADKPPSRLQCRHGRHNSTTSHPVATRPEDDDDSHDRMCTRRRRRFQAKFIRPSLRLSTLRSGEPPFCISPGPGLYIRAAMAPISGTTFTSSTIPFIHHCSRAPGASLRAALRLA